MRTHVDNNGGILASGDSGFLQYGRDNYSYVWPRDASMTALALDKAGNFEVTRKYFEFCNQVVSDEGYLHHKYRPDKALGSTWHPWFRGGKRELAIQEDESALTLFALWKHYKLTRDLEFVEQVYNSFIKKLADFMVLYRDSKLKLPQSSYDLWEEKFGTSTYTSSTVYGALIAASNFANLLMKREDETNYLMAAREIKTGIMKHLYNPSEKYFYRTIKIKDGVVTEKDQTVDASSFYGIFYFKVLDIDDPRLKDAEKVVREKLGCQTQIGGIARYTEDQYFRTNPSGPGNPWFITTLWLTKYKIACANNESDLKRVREDLEWVASRANSAGVLSEQLDSYTGEQLSAIPLTMSHAEFVSTVISYLNKLEELGVREVCNPVK